MATVVVKITSPFTGNTIRFNYNFDTLQKAKEVEAHILEETTRCLRGNGTFWRTDPGPRSSSEENAYIFFPAEMLKNNFVFIYIKE